MMQNFPQAALPGAASAPASAATDVASADAAAAVRKDAPAARHRHARLLRRCLPTLALVAGLASASPDATAQREIDHLLDYVAASHCTFVRNGERYDAGKAREHLAMKLNFVRWRLSTADEFVKYLATESSVSHEPYLMICGKVEKPAGPWLATELSHFRKSERTASAH
jgi:hypothetical protein